MVLFSYIEKQQEEDKKKLQEKINKEKNNE